MKKFMSLFLALVLAMSAAMPVFADTTIGEEPTTPIAITKELGDSEEVEESEPAETDVEENEDGLIEEDEDTTEVITPATEAVEPVTAEIPVAMGFEMGIMSVVPFIGTTTTELHDFINSAAVGYGDTIVISNNVINDLLTAEDLPSGAIESFGIKVPDKNLTIMSDGTHEIKGRWVVNYDIKIVGLNLIYDSYADAADNFGRDRGVIFIPTASSATLTIEDSTITQLDKSDIILIGGGNNLSPGNIVNLTNVSMEATPASGSVQGITVKAKGSVVNMTNSSLVVPSTGGAYGVYGIVFQSESTVNVIDSSIDVKFQHGIGVLETTGNNAIINVTDSEISGYAAISVKAIGTTITVTDSILNGINSITEGSSSDWCAAVLFDKTADNGTLDMINTTVNLTNNSNGKNNKLEVGVSARQGAHTIKIDSDCVFTNDADGITSPAYALTLGSSSGATITTETVTLLAGSKIELSNEDVHVCTGDHIVIYPGVEMNVANIYLDDKSTLDFKNFIDNSSFMALEIANVSGYGATGADIPTVDCDNTQIITTADEYVAALNKLFGAAAVPADINFLPAVVSPDPTFYLQYQLEDNGSYKSGIPVPSSFSTPFIKYVYDIAEYPYTLDAPIPYDMYRSNLSYGYRASLNLRAFVDGIRVLNILKDTHGVYDDSASAWLDQFPTARDEEAYTLTDPNNPLRAIKLIVTYIPMCEVTYDFNDGTIAGTTTATKAPEWMEFGLDYSDELTLPVVEKIGYTFIEWCTDAALTTAFNPADAVKGHVDLYAKWQADPTDKHFNLRYMLEGNNTYKTGLPIPTDFVIDETYIYDVSVPLYEIVEAPIPFDIYRGNNPSLIRASLNLRAKVNKNVAVVVYDESGVTNSEGAYAQLVGFPGARVTENYTAEDPKDSARTINLQVTYVPMCEVIYNANGGTFADTALAAKPLEWIEYGTSCTEPVVTKAGFTFDGWYTDAGFSTKFDFSNTLDNHYDLYAKFTPIPTAAPRPLLAITPNPVRLSAVVGYSSANQQILTVQNNGTDVANQITVALGGTDASRFTVSPSSLADIAVNGRNIITIVPVTGLAVGTYTAQIVVRYSGGQTPGNYSVSIPVTFTVSPVSSGGNNGGGGGNSGIETDDDGLGWSRGYGGFTRVNTANQDTVTMTPDAVPLGAVEFEAPYINGYEDGTIRPNGKLTRAELAQIIYNLFGEEKNYSGASYSDVNADFWGYNAISFAELNNYMVGYPDDTFMPNAFVTRAELTTAVAKIVEVTGQAGNSKFSDVDGHWAEMPINGLTGKSVITGYEDGTFLPNNHITRTEACVVISRAFDRNYNSYLTNKLFADLNKDFWGYNYVMNAANGSSN